MLFLQFCTPLSTIIEYSIALLMLFWATYIAVRGCTFWSKKKSIIDKTCAKLSIENSIIDERGVKTWIENTIIDERGVKTCIENTIIHEMGVKKRRKGVSQELLKTLLRASCSSFCHTPLMYNPVFDSFFNTPLLYNLVFDSFFIVSNLSHL